MSKALKISANGFIRGWWFHSISYKCKAFSSSDVIIPWYSELLDYKEVCQALFKNKNTIQFFRLTGKDDFIIAKNTLIKEIMRRGREDWVEHELSEFTKVLELELQKKEPEEMMYEVVSKWYISHYDVEEHDAIWTQVVKI